MTLRKIIFWLHLTAGVFAGAVVFIMCVTGVALTYQKQMTEWADRSYWPVSTITGGQPLGVEALISKAVEAQPEGKPSAVMFYADPSAPAVVIGQPGSNVFIDRYTAATTVGGSSAMRRFFRIVTDWHRYLAADGENRAAGRAITGACNLAFLFIVSSGIYLWWPRNWTRQSVRGVTWFRRGLQGKARDFNWHNVFGFWMAIPLFFVVLSGVVMSYSWANSLVYKLAGTAEPVRGGAQGGPAARGGERRGERNLQFDLLRADELLANAERRIPDWRTINLRLPAKADRQVVFSIDRSYGGQPQMRSTLVFDKDTGRLIREETFSGQNAGQRARTWMRFVHTGEFYGTAGQTIAGIASAAGAMLVFTGLSLAFRRFWAWNARRSRLHEPIPVSRLSEE